MIAGDKWDLDKLKYFMYRMKLIYCIWNWHEKLNFTELYENEHEYYWEHIPCVTVLTVEETNISQRQNRSGSPEDWPSHTPCHMAWILNRPALWCALVKSTWSRGRKFQTEARFSNQWKHSWGSHDPRWSNLCPTHSHRGQHLISKGQINAGYTIHIRITIYNQN